jgi:hypothetical protein
MPVAIPAAIVGAAAIGGAASIAASNKASKTAKQVASNNNALATQQYNENKATLAPFVGAGTAATPAIQALLGLSGDATAQEAAFDRWRDATGYQDQFSEGQRAVTSALGNRGLLDSGAALKALTRYGQGQSNQSFGTYYNMLAGQQQVGLGAAQAQAGNSQGYVNAVSNNNNNAANTASNAALSNAGQINNLVSSALSAYGYAQGMGSSYGNSGGWASAAKGATSILPQGWR